LVQSKKKQTTTTTTTTTTKTRKKHTRKTVLSLHQVTFCFQPAIKRKKQVLKNQIIQRSCERVKTAITKETVFLCVWQLCSRTSEKKQAT
jgi:hypothetical protein